jgi:3',5'-cyclic AMP phosphodiesterase CpdA
VALVGLSTAVPQSLNRAGGTLGREQLAVLGPLLRDLRERGYARVLMIHHPPLPGLAAERKALTDATELRRIVEDEGADLLIHGHNHQAMVNAFATRFGTAHVIGVPSASMRPVSGHTPAGWHLFRIQRLDGRWQIDVTARSLQPDGGMATISQFTLNG